MERLEASYKAGLQKIQEQQEKEYKNWMREKGSELNEEYRDHLDDFYDEDEY